MSAENEGPSTTPSASPDVTQPPGIVGTGKFDLARELCRWGHGLLNIVLDPLIPRNPEPAEPLDPPDQKDEIPPEQLEQCVRIYDQVEATRKNLEDKARWTFTMVSFLTPLLLAMLVFMLGKTNVATASRTWAIGFSVLSGTFLLLGFISIVRSVAIQRRQDLFLDAVIDSDKKVFRSYNRTFYARGLLYCASFNAAMNAHIAQFVKGGQVLMAFAVISSILAAVPSAMVFAEAASSTPRMEIVGPVSVTSPQIDVLRSDIAKIGTDLKQLVGQQPTSADLKALEERVSALEARIVNKPAPPKQQNNASR